MERGNRVVCAWCFKIVSDGPEPITHTICSQCSAKQQLEMLIERHKLTIEDIEYIVSKLKHDAEIKIRRQATQ